MNTRAIILIAGCGFRMGELTRCLPKSFLKVDDETLLERNIRLLRQAGLTDITLVTGFRDDLIRATFPSCSFVHNPAYQISNTSVSLQLALRAVECGPVLVLNGDVYIEAGIIEQLVASADTSQAAVRAGPLGEEEVKVVVEGQRIRRIGKQLDPHLSHGEAFGLYYLTPAFASDLEFALRSFVDQDSFYELGMDLLLGAGARMDMLDVGHALAMELDTPDDLRALRAALAERRAAAHG